MRDIQHLGVEAVYLEGNALCFQKLAESTG